VDVAGGVADEFSDTREMPEEMSRPANPKVHEPQRQGAFHSAEPVSSTEEVAPVGIEGLTDAPERARRRKPRLSEAFL
jgi:hypothetical protein